MKSITINYQPLKHHINKLIQKVSIICAYFQRMCQHEGRACVSHPSILERISLVLFFYCVNIWSHCLLVIIFKTIDRPASYERDGNAWKQFLSFCNAMQQKELIFDKDCHRRWNMDLLGDNWNETTITAIAASGSTKPKKVTSFFKKNNVYSVSGLSNVFC